MLLSACPVAFYANLKNESAEKIVVSSPGDRKNPWIINGGERVQVIWYQECIIVIKASLTRFYAGWPIPENVVKTGVFSSSLNAVYKDNALFFETSAGKLIPVPEVGECESAQQQRPRIPSGAGVLRFAAHT